MGIHRNDGYEQNKLVDDLAKQIELIKTGVDFTEDHAWAEDWAKNNKKFQELLVKFDQLKDQVDKYNFPFKAYESIQVNGGVLVDGNYLYLESLRTFKDYVLDGNLNNPKFNKFFEGFYEEILSEKERKFYLDTFARDVDAISKSLAKIAKFLFTINTQEIYRTIIKNQYSVNKDIYSREELSNFIYGELQPRPKPSNTIYYDYELDINFFDAPLPELSESKRILDSEIKKKKYPKKFDSSLNYLDHGLWQSYHEGSTTLVPYELKNKYIENIKKSLSGDLVLGRKILKMNYFTGDIYGCEKEVDSRLTIKGVELANKSNLDFILLVTNDSDYVPLIEYIKDKGKAVFLYSAGNPKNTSKELRKSVGDECCMNRLDYLNDPFYKNISEGSENDFKYLAMTAFFWDDKDFMSKMHSYHSENYEK